MSFEFPTQYGKVVLGGVLGSHAQGFATAESDIDRGFVFAAPTLALVGLTPPDPSVQLHDPDMWGHEVGKFVHLALQCNPTILELLWIEHDVYTTLGDCLVMHREKFLTSKLVYNAYRGYAKQQIARAESELRTEKARRHALRLMLQCYQALDTGQIVVNPGRAWVAGIRTASQSLETFTEMYEELDRLAFAAYAHTDLPPEPDRAAAAQLVQTIRQYVIDREQATK